MVVAHTIAQETTATTKTHKNRRKISKKNGGQPRSGEASTSHVALADDTEMVYDGSITDVISGSTQTQDDELMIDVDSSNLPAQADVPAFPPVAPGANKASLKSESRRIPVPPHRMTPLKKEWLNLFGPLTEILFLQVRMNVQRRCVEIRVRPKTLSSSSYLIPPF